MNALTIVRRGILIVSVLLLPSAARADDVVVQCGADPATLPPGTYSSLNAALSHLSLEGPHTITVIGTCRENVHGGLQSRERLTIQGPEGDMASIINDANPPFWVLAVGRSRQISFRRLVVSGGSVGIRIDSASSVDVTDCVIEDNSQGMLADENATVRLNRVTIRNSQGAGLVVTRGSQVSVSLGPGPGEPAFIAIRGNGGTGITINDGSVTMSRGATIEDNGGNAINVTGGFLQMSGGVGDAGNILRNNGSGINASGNATVSLSGANLIEKNGGFGIQIARGSSLTINAMQAPGGTPLITTIDGHRTVGINVVQGSSAAILGAHRIQANGFESPQPQLTAGIRAGGSSLNLTGPLEVTGNNGPGVWGDLNSTITIGSPPGAAQQITRNAAEGIRLTALSVASWLAPPAISANGGASVSCDRSSWLFGDIAGMSEIRCSNADRGR